MAFLVEVDNEDVIHATTHGIISRSDLSFLRERMDTSFRTATGNARRYLEVARDKLASFDFGKLRDSVEGMRDRFGKRWDQDRVAFLPGLVDLRNAKPTMRNYIMADTRIRLLYQQGRCEGYGDGYVDDEVGAIGRDHSTYREVMNGSYSEGSEGEDTFVTYLGIVDEHGDSNLSHDGKQLIRRTWAELRAILDMGVFDPTSAKGKTL